MRSARATCARAQRPSALPAAPHSHTTRHVELMANNHPPKLDMAHLHLHDITGSSTSASSFVFRTVHATIAAAPRITTVRHDPHLSGLHVPCAERRVPGRPGLSSCAGQLQSSCLPNHRRWTPAVRSPA
ncbi:hypothetical protein GUJ93_ZPchr0008g12320 [Zizania palustris]|uniref:Uncharacterized protein n=1 Tax=Zizania palustris TaxID=103762 RepID=A0A8J5QYK2_ZIZPA|nr:hypothetical protein GUJ93_ZPchr0008g12320 [Zizania palustris]